MAEEQLSTLVNDLKNRREDCSQCFFETQMKSNFLFRLIMIANVWQ